MLNFAAAALLAITAALSAQDTARPPEHDTPDTIPSTAPRRSARQTPAPAGTGLPLKPDRTIVFTTTEGTWLSPDLSPDGRRIAFELLGDLYTVDARGGTARAITSGMAFDAQPAFSPDGRRIVFVSDRSGADNIWIADADGTHPRPITALTEDSIFTSPTWSADGTTIYMSRYRPEYTGFALQAVDIATGRITELVATGGAAQASTVGAKASRDGRWLYYASQVGAHDIDPPGWVIRRRDLRSGAEETIVEPQRSYRPDLVLGTYFRPLPSPDGRLLVYATRSGAELWLRVLDLVTREDRWLTRLTQRDELAGAPWRDLAPNYAFTPDSRALVVNDGGKLRRVALADGRARDIPFTAAVRLPLGPLNAPAIREEAGPVRARVIQHPMQSPDGSQLAFSALGRVYVMSLAPGGARPRPLTHDAIGEYEPSWSADGRSILYVRWTARDGGHVMRAAADGTGTPQRLSDIAANYTSPVETPDGKSVLVLRSSNAARMHRYMEYGPLRQAELALLPANGGAARVVATGTMGGLPHFGPDAARAALLFDDGLNLVSLADGTRELLLQVTGPGYYFLPGRAPVDDLRLSPDGGHVLAQIAQQLYVLGVPAKHGTTIDLAAPGVASRKLTDVGADFLQWSGDGRTIGWSLGSSWFRRPLADVALTASVRADVPDLGKPVRADAVVELPRATATGALVLRGATVLAIAGDRTIPDADVLIVDGRFAGVGPRGTVALPAGAEVRDVAGKWIVPGFIDDHDHVADIRRGVLDLQSWGPAANLAYGITTAFDPSTLSIDMLPYQDLIDAGLMVGSRIRSTGPAIFSFNEFTSKAAVDRVLDRYRDFYRLDNIKLYRTGNRRVRQWIAQSAREHRLRVTGEGATSDKLDLTMVQDGVSGNEHALPAAPFYDDLVTLFAKSGVSYNLTLMVNGGAQDRFVIDKAANHDAKLNRFTPRFVVDMKTRKREWRLPEDDAFPAFAESGARVARAGGIVGMGSHGEIPGLGFHWEMQAHARGGWTPAEILRAATLGSAEAIGRAADLGTIEVGKIADLVVLNRDPTLDIRNAEAIAQVMQAGRLYDGATLDELWPVRRPFPVPWYWNDGPPASGGARDTPVP